MKKIYLIVITFFLLSACGDSRLMTQSGNLPDGNANIAMSAFSLGSDFPADLVIPDIDGMRNTAFVVSLSAPTGVVAVDISSTPMRLSRNFVGLVSPSGSGLPNSLAIASIDEAYLLTSTSIISFNPKTGTVYAMTSALQPVNVPAGRPTSSGAAAPMRFTPSYPSGIAVVGDRLFIANSNYTRVAFPAATNPGIIQAFTINRDRSLTRIGVITTTCFNPTALTPLNEHTLLITDTGVLDITDDHGVASSESCIEVLDAATLNITRTIPLGLAAAGPQQLAITSDGTRAFAASATQAWVLEVDLINGLPLRDANNPIVFHDGADLTSAVLLTTDDATLYAASFEQSRVFGLALPDTLLPNPFIIGFPAGVTDANPSGANTGAGAMAWRPGIRETDFTGADMFVLTAYPGQLMAIDTQHPGRQPLPSPPSVDRDPPPPPAGAVGTACQGFAQGVISFTPGPGGGFNSHTLPNIVLGPPEGNWEQRQASLDVVSLGHGGTIILDLGNCAAVDGPGADFIVFENPFPIAGDLTNPYAELGEVSVSDDGLHFTRFPCNAGAYPYSGCAGWQYVTSNSRNGISPFDVDAAGGDAFDLADIGVARARYVRITSLSNIGTSPKVGFDLDALSVINGEIH